MAALLVEVKSLPDAVAGRPDFTGQGSRTGGLAGVTAIGGDSFPAERKEPGLRFRLHLREFSGSGKAAFFAILRAICSRFDAFIATLRGSRSRFGALAGGFSALRDGFDALGGGFDALGVRIQRPRGRIRRSRWVRLGSILQT